MQQTAFDDDVLGSITDLISVKLQQLEDLLYEFHDVFSKHDLDLGHTSLVKYVSLWCDSAFQQSLVCSSEETATTRLGVAWILENLTVGPLGTLTSYTGSMNPWTFCPDLSGFPLWT